MDLSNYNTPCSTQLNSTQPNYPTTPKHLTYSPEIVTTPNPLEFQLAQHPKTP